MVRWTEAQNKAIFQKGENILVSAAAGSGKTAVLVERIAEHIQTKDLSELLVVTFTQAAAAEMKERVRTRLEESLKNDPNNTHLQKQVACLPGAFIMTLHSFCLHVVRNYAYLLGIDPMFTIANETDLSLLRVEVLEELLENYYEKADPVFLKLVAWFGGERTDEGLTRLIFQIYTYAQKQPNPEEWLKSLQTPYLEWRPMLEEIVKDWISELDPVFQSEHERLAEFYTVIVHGSWEEISEQCLSFSFERLKNGKDIKETAKKKREKIKEEIQELQTKLFSLSFEEHQQFLDEATPLLEELTKIVNHFKALYQEAKKEKGWLDFDDLEHYTLALLRQEKLAQFTEIIVDEYQDTNAIQESILNLIGKQCLFMVGDVKQSVYRFRLAEPNIFVGKYHQFQEDETRGITIELSHNFRSRKPVIEFANLIFAQLMQLDLGGIQYDDKVALRYASSYPEAHESLKPELVLLDRTEKESGESAELEGEWIAERIQELMGFRNQTARHVLEKNGEMRPLQYKDIVILMRSMTSAPIIAKSLERMGIPVSAPTNQGYFQTVEIEVVLSLLRMIDNPDQDIPLASVLRSPISPLNDEDLAQLRIENKNDSLYTTLKNQKDNSKIVYFLNKLKAWQEASKFMPLSSFLWYVLEDTQYYAWIAGLPGGSRRQANLNILFEKARQYEEKTQRSLFSFLRYLSNLQDQDEDFGEASSGTDGENVVRIMTIHKSKGLEFPIVFMAGLSKNFNQQDLHLPVLLHSELGIGLKVMDEDEIANYPTLPYWLLQFQTKKELVAEEIRILYVALTRAKESLYLIGCTSNVDQKIEGLKGGLSHYRIVNAKSYLDWILMSLLSEDENLSSPYFEFTKVIPEIIELEEEKSHQVLCGEPFETSDHYIEEISRRFDWKYKDEEIQAIPAKMTVTELRNYLYSASTDVSLQIPKFMAQEVSAPQERGTAFHLIMQHISFQGDASIENTVEDLIRRKILTEDQAKQLDYQAISNFLSSDLGEKLQRATWVKRELNCSFLVPLNKIYSINHDKPIVIQGVMDLVFEIDGQIIVVDYKTDKRVNQEKINQYQHQILLYREALEKALRQKVSASYLYFFETNQALKINT